MSKMTTTAIFAAMLALTAPAFAQTAAAPHNAAASSGETQMRPDQIRASKFIGSTVYDVQNRNIGSVKELLFDKSGRIEDAVVDVGSFLGMGGKLVAVPLRDIKTENNRLTLDMTKEQLKAARDFKFNQTESTGSSVPPGSRNDNNPNRR